MTKMTTVTTQIPVAPWGTHGCPRKVTVQIHGDTVECIAVSQEPCGTCDREIMPGDAMWAGSVIEAVRWHVKHGSCGQAGCPICETAKWEVVAR